MSAAPHDASVAVWDVPSPAVRDRPFRIKVGVTCSQGCALVALDVEVRDDGGVQRASGQLGTAPWPDTAALYWTELEVPGPASEGQHTWHVASPGEPRSHAFSGSFTITAAAPPQHTVTVLATDIIDRAPVQGVHVRIGPYRAVTDERGQATPAVGPGSYEVIVWKAGYEAAPVAIAVAGDTTVRVDLQRATRSPEPYWM